MADVTLPLALIGGLGAAVVAAGKLMWSRIGEVEKRERDSCAEQIRRLEEACEKRTDELSKRVEKLETAAKEERATSAEWQGRWIREVERGAQLAAMPRRPEDPPPRQLPAPEWEEDTALRSARARVEGRALDGELSDYLRKTTPPEGTRSARKAR